jgi:hypothetical protein
LIGNRDAMQSALCHALLLKEIGCSANSVQTSALFGSDDHAVKRNLKTVDWTSFRSAD